MPPIAQRLPEHRSGLWQKYVSQAQEAFELLYRFADDASYLNLTDKKFDEKAAAVAGKCGDLLVELDEVRALLTKLRAIDFEQVIRRPSDV